MPFTESSWFRKYGLISRYYCDAMQDVSRLTAQVTMIMAAGILACGAPPTVARRTCPVSGWRVQVTPDSELDFCAPPDIVQVNAGHLWTRADADSQPSFVGEEWLNINALSASAAFDEIQPWPPSLLRDTSYASCIHCLDVTAYRVHWETIAGRIVRVETGRVTGGFYGVRDKPALEAAWLADSTRWVFVQGEARTDSALNELRAIVRTIRLRR